MQFPIQVMFHDLPVSDAVEAVCWEEAAKLEKTYNQLMSCRVVIAASHPHRNGEVFNVRVELRLPGGTITIDREAAAHRPDKDVYSAIRNAFDGARHELVEHIRELAQPPRDSG
jgi:ribosome-associated translation inhibitor RaiA